MISPHIYHDIPHGTEHPHGTRTHTLMQGDRENDIIKLIFTHKWLLHFLIEHLKFSKCAKIHLNGLKNAEVIGDRRTMSTITFYPIWNRVNKTGLTHLPNT